MNPGRERVHKRRACGRRRWGRPTVGTPWGDRVERAASGPDPSGPPGTQHPEIKREPATWGPLSQARVRGSNPLRTHPRRPGAFRLPGVCSSCPTPIRGSTHRRPWRIGPRTRGSVSRWGEERRPVDHCTHRPLRMRSGSPSRRRRARQGWARTVDRSSTDPSRSGSHSGAARVDL